MQRKIEVKGGKDCESDEKVWENPDEPAYASDERDKEQLLRQYKEAKRRNGNLTNNETAVNPDKL